MKKRYCSRNLRKACHQAEKLGLTEIPTVVLGVASIYDKNKNVYREWQVNKKYE